MRAVTNSSRITFMRCSRGSGTPRFQKHRLTPARGDYKKRNIVESGETMEEIGRDVKEFILREFLQGEDPDALTDSTPLITGGILDSLATLKLVAFLEERFKVTVA